MTLSRNKMLTLAIDCQASAGYWYDITLTPTTYAGRRLIVRLRQALGQWLVGLRWIDVVLALVLAFRVFRSYSP